jgi:hypothetical protein
LHPLGLTTEVDLFLIAIDRTMRKNGIGVSITSVRIALPGVNLGVFIIIEIRENKVDKRKRDTDIQGFNLMPPTNGNENNLSWF